ncbi:glycosyltransferase family 2 protein [Aerobium aerolatum]|uniref:Glycosyltransferase, catalytic subunit of cellulose synthase and poly-beta-1,6-N-acetylglucosamine synthase n=1 Tax=Aquamicrobium aerolatum DSM 21857 TaxID=1121003 RepID=A0A1I3R2S5_9HYPH|nr:glycosyltransferase family 2 protein [Aquamicrobium aerolatum]SFJ40032.1 Glycosyltransferase, catalytic subunit of cellulose synthase and poly-beta-1,6-N-acetylglucosamine synthase [Aquamicrobium aerolatum DSM 21857]
MATTIWLLTFGAASLLAVPAAIYTIECLAGALPRRRDRHAGRQSRPAIAILVPAHDEALGITRTVESVRAQMRAGDRLVVIADNCSDNTAAMARKAGAEVIERTDPSRIGKGYALDFGISHLASAPLPVVAFVDADCTLTAGTLDALSCLVSCQDRPVQASNLMITRGDQKEAFGISEFAFMVKNHVRARGLNLLGLPCQLTGTGMALPWHLASNAHLASGEIVEDMKLGLDLAAAGHYPLYCEEAGVRSYFPDTAASAQIQHRRWEHGHLGIMISGLRRFAQWRSFSLPYAAMILDVMVPPLMLLVFMIVALTVISAAVAVAGLGYLPFLLCTVLFMMVTGGTLIAWLVHGRRILPLSSLLLLPRYLASKIALYVEMFFSRSPKISWVRTSRASTVPPSAGETMNSRHSTTNYRN